RVNGESSPLELTFRSSHVVPIASRRETSLTAIPAAEERVPEEPAEAEETGGPASNRIAFLLCALAASVALVVALFVYPGWLRHSAKTAPVVQDFSPLPMRVAPTAAVPRTKPSPLKAQPAATA